MPSVSKAQSAAMHAAAAGRSTLGIPKKVGRDFVNADKGRKVGAQAEHVKAAKPKKPERDRRAEFMAQRAKEHGSVRKAAGEFKTSKSSLHRRIRQGYDRLGSA